MTKNLILLAFAFCVSTLAGAQNLLEKNSNKITVKDFPVPAANQKQVVIDLPAKLSPEEERNYKVEIIPGKKMMVDCNHHGLNGNIEEKIVEGMGVNYYIFNTNGEIRSTRMGCPDNSKHEAFVTAQSIMVDYNSRIPVVVYIPKEYEVKYRIWSAGEIMLPEMPAEEIKDTSKKLYGVWQWVSSKGGYTGGKTALKNTGMSKVYCFKNDGSYTQSKKGKMVPGGKFKLTNGASIFIKGILPMIELSDRERKMSYTFVGCDTLILSEECFDCYKHTYIRKK